MHWPQTATGQIELIAGIFLIVAGIAAIGLRIAFRSQWNAEPKSVPQPVTDRTGTWARQPTGEFSRIEQPRTARHRYDDLDSHTTRITAPQLREFQAGRATVYTDNQAHRDQQKAA